MLKMWYDYQITLELEFDYKLKNIQGKMLFYTGSTVLYYVVQIIFIVAGRLTVLADPNKTLSSSISSMSSSIWRNVLVLLIITILSLSSVWVQASAASTFLLWLGSSVVHSSLLEETVMALFNFGVCGLLVLCVY